MTTRIAWLLTVAALLAACASSPPITAATLPSDADAGATFPDDDPKGVSARDACAVSYRVLRSCHCHQAEPTNGVAFPEWCRSMGFAIDTACIAKAATCKALPGCHVTCVTTP